MMNFKPYITFPQEGEICRKLHLSEELSFDIIQSDEACKKYFKTNLCCLDAKEVKEYKNGKRIKRQLSEEDKRRHMLPDTKYDIFITVYCFNKIVKDDKYKIDNNIPEYIYFSIPLDFFNSIVNEKYVIFDLDDLSRTVNVMSDYFVTYPMQVA